MESAFLLDVVVTQRAAVLKLLASKDETLLVRRNTLLVLDLTLDIVNRVRRLDLQSNSLASEGLNKDLHGGKCVGRTCGARYICTRRVARASSISADKNILSNIHMLVTDRVGAGKHGLTVVAALFLCFLGGYYVGRRSGLNESEIELDISDDEQNEYDGPSPEECKMVLGVRMDLKMDKGKIAAQCGCVTTNRHATLAAYQAAKRQCPQYIRTWQLLGQTKIAVKIPDEESMLKIEKEARELGVPARSIQDACVFAN